ncbi:hypothetical protein BY458DRAFT_446453 [Sporodiniella umbellata]|nr:hypothetical protein BY458DRAFT_446453 [Sporodiniella umbellata]
MKFSIKNLENQIAHRSNVQDLVDRNIMRDPRVAPAIQRQQEDLERRQVKDSLRHKIDHRPSLEELIDRNIMKGSHLSVAPALQKNRSELEKRMLHDKLEHKLNERPQFNELVSQGILKGKFFFSKGIDKIQRRGRLILRIE